MLLDLLISRLILFRFFYVCVQFWNKKDFLIEIFATNEKRCQMWICPMEKCLIYFIFFVWLFFNHKTNKFWFRKPLKYFNVFDKTSYEVRFKNVPWNNVWYSSISIFWVHVIHKTCVKINEYVLSDSVWIGLSFVVKAQFQQKLRNSKFKLYWNSLMILN